MIRIVTELPLFEPPHGTLLQHLRDLPEGLRPMPVCIHADHAIVEQQYGRLLGIGRAIHRQFVDRIVGNRRIATLRDARGLRTGACTRYPRKPDHRAEKQDPPADPHLRYPLSGVCKRVRGVHS